MFCMFLNVRYSNPKLMHVGHQFVAANFDASKMSGLLEVNAYHITPDKGVGIFIFNNHLFLKYSPFVKDDANMNCIQNL